MKRTLDKSNGRMEAFAHHYVRLQFNGKQAAVAAGYSKSTAESKASQLLRNGKVKALIAKFSAPLAKKLDISVERTLAQLARHAYVDARELYDEKGKLKKITELNEDIAARIAGVRQIGKRTVEYKLSDQLRALDMLGKYLKLFAEDRNPVDLGVKIIIMDAPRPNRVGFSNAAALPAPGNGNGTGHNGNGNGSGPHDD